MLLKCKVNASASYVCKIRHIYDFQDLYLIKIRGNLL